MKTDRDYKKYYDNLKETIQELANLAGVKDLDKYYVPLCTHRMKRDGSDKLTDKIVMEQFALSLQNSGRGHKLIQFPADGENPANGNEQKVYEKFSNLELFDPAKYPNPAGYCISSLTDELRTFYRNGIWAEKRDSVSDAKNRTDAKSNNKDSLEVYVQGLFKAADFLKEMHGSKNEKGKKSGLKLVCEAVSLEPDKWDENQMVDRPKRSEPNVLHELRKIDGLGPALSRDFLKECGCLWLAKPDVHLIAVLTKIGILDNLGVKNDYYYSKTVNGANEFSKRMFEFADSVSMNAIDENVTPFKIDKMIWLACTGSFYLEEPPVTLGLREILIRKLKK